MGIYIRATRRPAPTAKVRHDALTGCCQAAESQARPGPRTVEAVARTRCNSSESVRRGFARQSVRSPVLAQRSTQVPVADEVMGRGSHQIGLQAHPEEGKGLPQTTCSTLTLLHPVGMYRYEARPDLSRGAETTRIPSCSKCGKSARHSNRFRIRRVLGRLGSLSSGRRIASAKSRAMSFTVAGSSTVRACGRLPS